jgi:sugar fermentation stimulation protein A
MADVKYLRPHEERDPAFAAALREASENGVRILAVDCAVSPETMQLRLPVPVRL